MRRLIFRNDQSPGDVVMLTAAVRDLHRCYPGRFVTDVRTPCPQLWENNPFITPLRESDPRVEVIECHYPLIHRSNVAPYHFIHGFIQFLNERLDLNIRPTAFKGDIHLSEEEMDGPSPLVELGRATLLRSRDQDDLHLASPSEGAESFGSAGASPYPAWLICAGGKRDFTVKWWEGARYQRVVDHFRGRIQFVQVGAASDHHFDLKGVIDLRGKTDLRQLIRLVYHCDGALCPVTLLMHLAAAVPVNPFRVSGFGFRVHGGAALRPCVVIAGGREPAHWEEYPGHQFLHTIGMLPCCASGGCWRSRTLPLGDGDEKDHPENMCVDVVGNLPRCMHMITAEDVIRRIEMYLDGSSSRREEAQSNDGRATLLRSRDQPAPHLTPALSAPSEGAEREKSFGSAGASPYQSEDPLTIDNAAERAEEFIPTIPTYPGGFAGRGIVICGGGAKYYPCAWVCIQMLRRLGCRLPIQLWHLGPEEVDEEMKALVKPLEVECVDGMSVSARQEPRPTVLGGTLSPWRGEGEASVRLGGWELKPFAILHCPFKEVLYLDADNVPVVNPEFLFDTPQFAMTGAIFWPDYRRLGPWRSIWQACGVPYQDEPEFESGQIVVDKERCWRALRLTMWYNQHSDFFYQHIHGDKETFHMAFRKLGQMYAMPTTRIQSLENVVMCQHDFDGNRIFQHRNLAKWTLQMPNRRISGFQFEKECLAYLEQLRRRWSRTALVNGVLKVVQSATGQANGAVRAGTVTLCAVMISCPEREAIRQETLRNLAASDWGEHEVQVVIDQTQLPCRRDRQTETSRRALLRALEMPGDYVLFLEDDLEFNPHWVENLRGWEPLQSGLVTLGGLYNPNIGQPEPGDAGSWFIADPEKIYGSQAFLLSKEAVRFCLEHWAEVEGMQDIKMSRLAARMGRAIFYHAPSLVQHVGTQSSWGGCFHQAVDFDREWRCLHRSQDQPSAAWRPAGGTP